MIARKAICRLTAAGAVDAERSAENFNVSALLLRLLLGEASAINEGRARECAPSLRATEFHVHTKRDSVFLLLFFNAAGFVKDLATTSLS